MGFRDKWFLSIKFQLSADDKIIFMKTAELRINRK